MLWAVAYVSFVEGAYRIIALKGSSIKEGLHSFLGSNVSLRTINPLIHVVWGMLIEHSTVQGSYVSRRRFTRIL